MSKVVLGVGMGALIAAGAMLFLQQQDSAELRREMALLRAELKSDRQNASPPARAAKADALPVSAGTVATGGFDQTELKKLREDLTALRKSTQEISQFAQMAQTAAALKTLGNSEATIPTKLTPADALKNLGRATPESATQTVLWAAVGGDVETLASAFVFTPTAREKANAWFAGLSENTRQQYGSPEKVIALMIAKDAAGLSGMQVLGQKEIAPDNVGVRVRFGSVDGKTKDDNLVMQRSSDGWRMVLPDNAVEKFARQLSGAR